MGLRELKKERTRRQIAEAAHRLFAEQGFDAVRVAEVARAAEVSEATVFNYFPAKEDLFFAGLDDFGARLVTAVRDRAPGESVLTACRRELLAGNSWLEAIDAGDAETLARARTVTRVIDASPALQARERLALARTAETLATVLGGDLPARVVAAAVAGLHGELIRHTRRLITDAAAPQPRAAGATGAPPHPPGATGGPQGGTGAPQGGLVDRARAEADRAFRLLERGLADYGRDTAAQPV